ncbi:MAG: C45 family autoproteolytic acyltransferase/hydrolase [Candidatus Omnitrophica bacterium]|nr:C45 family autoproteolytic acyltransferase/hydrolase [Candidatus Omnitrophota bacterium]
MEEGLVSRMGRINVLELSGDHRQMGRQYGKLFKSHLIGFYESAVNDYFIKKEHFSYLKLLALSRLLFRSYPAKFKEMFIGMSETSGMGLSKLVMLDQLNAFELVRNQNIGRCSNISAWGDYSILGTLILGRNFDQPEYFKKFNEFITLTVLNPDDGIPVINIGYAGQIGINSAMNKRGVFMANNEAPVIKGDTININAPNVLLAELEFLMRSSSLSDLDKHISPIIVSAADAKNACTYEWTASDMKCAQRRGNGLIVTTNHFIDPSWKRPSLSHHAYGMTEERLANLISLGEEHKGKIDAKKMRELLDIGLDEGGATHSDKTIFQMVAVPIELKIWLKVPGYQDWTEVDLRKLFAKYDANPVPI